MWQLIPKCFPKMWAPVQPLHGQTEPIWCAQQQPPWARTGTCVPWSISAQRCCQVCSGGAVGPELLLLRAELRLVLCRVPPSSVFAQSCLWFIAQGLSKQKGRELSSSLVAGGNGGPKELKVRQKMSVLSCLEVCNYDLMADGAQVGIQKLVSASETRNAGGASLPPICGLRNAMLQTGCASAPFSEEISGGKACFSDFEGY